MRISIEHPGDRLDEPITSWRFRRRCGGCCHNRSRARPLWGDQSFTSLAFECSFSFALIRWELRLCERDSFVERRSEPGSASEGRGCNRVDAFDLGRAWCNVAAMQTGTLSRSPVKVEKTFGGWETRIGLRISLLLSGSNNQVHSYAVRMEFCDCFSQFRISDGSVKDQTGARMNVYLL
jgi:hypothetical protein